MKTLFIVNPVAGRNNCYRIWNDIKAHIDFPHEVILTKGPVKQNIWPKAPLNKVLSEWWRSEGTGPFLKS